jgi:hypothetical protein
MLEILKFSVSGFFTFIGCYMIIVAVLYFVINGVVRIFVRFFRTITILFRGWPPSHLDADGDFRDLSIE